MTKLQITVLIDHDSEETKQQGLDVWCKGLKEGQNVRGSNSKGESYRLTVEDVTELDTRADVAVEDVLDIRAEILNSYTSGTKSVTDIDEILTKYRKSLLKHIDSEDSPIGDTSMSVDEFEGIIKPLYLLSGKDCQFIRKALLGNFHHWKNKINKEK